MLSASSASLYCRVSWSLHLLCQIHYKQQIYANWTWHTYHDCNLLGQDTGHYVQAAVVETARRMNTECRSNNSTLRPSHTSINIISSWHCRNADSSPVLLDDDKTLATRTTATKPPLPQSICEYDLNGHFQYYSNWTISGKHGIWSLRSRSWVRILMAAWIFVLSVVLCR